MKELKFLIQIDSKSYYNKPNGAEIGAIKSRTQKSLPQKLTAKEILEAIEEGKSFSPGIMVDGLKAENWSSQQIFAIDIDNENADESILHPKKALEICQSKKLNPIILYKSFSYKKEKPKFRIIFATDKLITNESERCFIYEVLLSLYPQADKSCINADRIFFGTNTKGSCGAKTITFEQVIEAYESQQLNVSNDLTTELEGLKKKFDFEDYLINKCNLEIINENKKYIKFKKCPICGHNDCFLYYKQTKSFFCFGKNGNKGGSIIDFLMCTKQFSKKEAVLYFQKELWGVPIEKCAIQQPEPLITISAKDLLEENLPPLFFCVENLISQGLTILAAPPKSRKSWFVLDMCLKVASGKDFLGFNTNKCKTLYLALEDSRNRMQKRIIRVLEPGEDLEECEISTGANSIDKGLINTLEDYVKRKRDIKLIVIDTLQKVRSTLKSQNVYAKDYEDLGCLKAFADKYAICVLVVHHLRKSNKKDPNVFNQISGTNGIMGSADTVLVIKKEDDCQSILHITGRDVAEEELVLQFDDKTCRWNCAGNREAQEEKRIRNEYEKDPVIIGINKILKETWEGTATDLKNAFALVHIYIEDTPAILSKKLKKLSELMFKYDGITYTAPPKDGSNGKRVHKFKKSETYLSFCTTDEDLDYLFNKSNITSEDVLNTDIIDTTT